MLHDDYTLQQKLFTCLVFARMHDRDDCGLQETVRRHSMEKERIQSRDETVIKLCLASADSGLDVPQHLIKVYSKF